MADPVQEETLHIFRIWEAWTTADESGRPADLIGAFTTEKKAVIAAEGQGWWGGPGKVIDAHVIKVNDQFFRLAHPAPIELDQGCEDRQKALREKGLAKLTPAERDALNV